MKNFINLFILVISFSVVYCEQHQRYFPNFGVAERVASVEDAAFFSPSDAYFKDLEGPCGLPVISGIQVGYLNGASFYEGLYFSSSQTSVINIGWQGYLQNHGILGQWTLNNILQIYNDDRELFAVKARIGLDFFSVDDYLYRYRQIRYNILCSKQINRLLFFMGARGPIVKNLTADELSNDSSLNQTLWYVGAEYQLNRDLSMYIQYYSNEISFGISLQTGIVGGSLPVVISGTSAIKFGHPFWDF